MKRRLVPLAGFCYVWLMIGFFTGTLVLLGPARWLSSEIQSRGYSPQTESMWMIALIAAYVLLSAIAALLVFRRLTRCQTRRVQLGVPAILTLAAGVCLWAWFDPALLAKTAGGIGGDLTAGRAQFVFGPYPQPERVAELKKQGFDAVISLQHPAVLPFEPASIKKESAAAERVGLTFIHAPMLPWLSANDESLAKIREIARTGRGRYYVHCGLGRDRVNIVKRMLELEGARIQTDASFKEARSFAARYAENRPMERGPIVALDKDVWLVPYPNKHESYNNMLAGQVKHVTLILDPADHRQAQWIRVSQKLFGDFKIPTTLVTLAPGNTAYAEKIARNVRRAERPEVVIVPFTAPHPGSEVADTFIAAYKRGRV